MKNSARPKLYRALEMLPGLATWTTFIGGAILSFYQPAWVAVFIIIFDLYFFFMALNVLFHLLHAYRILEIHKSQDWLQRCKDLIDTKNLLKQLRELHLQSKDRRVSEVFEQEIEKISELAARGAVIDYKKILHVVLLPMVSEPYEVIKSSVDSYFQSRYPKESMILVLATEERAGEKTSLAAEIIASEYSGKFRKVLVTKHPDAVPGEARVKGANITYAARQAKKLVDEIGLDYKDVIVSAFDADTVVGPDYFAKLTYVYLTEKSPTRASYQPTQNRDKYCCISPQIMSDEQSITVQKLLPQRYAPIFNKAISHISKINNPPSPTAILFVLPRKGICVAWQRNCVQRHYCL